MFENEAEISRELAEASFYSLTVDSLSGEPVPFSRYEGRVAIVVNVASRCGFTPQYEGLQQLYEDFQSRGVVVLGFPSNDFGNQEPGDAEEISEFCEVNFGITFPMFAKVQTRPGDGQSTVYRMLGGATGRLPGWNFCKYVVSADGRRATFFASTVTPDSPELRNVVERELQFAERADGG